jgi:hypothetical protein
MRIEGLWWKLPFTLGSLAIIGVIVFGMQLLFRDCTAKHPCHDTVEVINGGEHVNCTNGASVQTEQMTGGSFVGDRVIVRCVCRTADAGQ